MSFSKKSDLPAASSSTSEGHNNKLLAQPNSMDISAQALAERNQEVNDLMQVEVSQSHILAVVVNYHGQNYCFNLDLSFWDKQKAAKEYLYLWLLEAFRTIERMDTIAEIKINFNTNVDQEISDLLMLVFNMMNNTKKHLRWLNKHPGLLAYQEQSPDRCLFLNIDENDWGKAFYHNLSQVAPETLFREFKSGFNRVKRRWETSDLMGEPQEVIEYLIENQIKTIVTINIYFLQNYMEYKALFFDRVLEALGVDVVMFDVDPFTTMYTGMWYKRIFTGGHLYRQTHIPVDYAPDQRFGIGNTRYVSLPTAISVDGASKHDAPKQDTQEKTLSVSSFPSFEGSKKLIVMSNLRLQSITSVLAQVFWLHDRLDPENPYQDYRLWYSAVRAIIGRPDIMSEYSDCLSGAMINQIAYTYGHLAKLLIMHELVNDYEVEIYGDESWGLFFPDQYQRKYVAGAEKTALLKSPGNLQLMFNWNDSWLSGSNVLQHLANGIPFLNFPPETIPEAWGPLEIFCYRTMDQLKERLSGPIEFNTPEVVEALRSHYEIIEAGWRDGVDAALSPTPDSYRDPFVGIYGQSQKLHLEIRDANVKSFIDNRPQIIEESIGMLVPNKTFSFSINNSSLSGHPIVEKLIRIHKGL